MDFPLQNTLHIPFVLKTKVNITEYFVAACYNIQIPLALHVLPALLASIAKEQGRIQLHSVL